MAFVFRAVDEVGATLNCALVVLGDQLGYYRDLAAHGPTRRPRWPTRTGTGEPYAREWLNAQAAGGFVEYDAGPRRYTPAARAGRRADRREQPRVPARASSRSRYGTVRDAARIVDAARAGDRARLAPAQRRRAHRLRAVLPARVRGQPRRRPGCPPSTASPTSWSAGALVADVGCGHGASTILMAQAYPRSTFIGSDYHPESIATAANGPAAPGSASGSASRSPAGGELRGHRLRPGDDVRLPARHGRPGRRGRARPARRSPPTGPG